MRYLGLKIGWGGFFVTVIIILLVLVIIRNFFSGVIVVFYVSFKSRFVREGKWVISRRISRGNTE